MSWTMCEVINSSDHAGRDEVFGLHKMMNASNHFLIEAMNGSSRDQRVVLKLRSRDRKKGSARSAKRRRKEVRGPKREVSDVGDEAR